MRTSTLDPNGTAAAICLAFLATAGLFYVNIMPALVSGLVDGLGFTDRQAGLIGSANVYGAAAGALIAVFLVRRVPWRPLAKVLLATLIAVDLGSMLLSEANSLMVVRALHGVAGGCLVGTGLAVIARTAQPDRSFGWLLLVQFGLGGLGVMFLPPLVPVWGSGVLFLALIAFSLVTWGLLTLLPPYPPAAAPEPLVDGSSGIAWRPLLLVLLALFLFQAGNMGLYAYIMQLGRGAGLDDSFIGQTLLASAWVGLLGSGLVIVMGTRFGRTLPLAAGMVLTVIGNWALHWSAEPWAFVVANLGVGVTWAFVIPYLFGMTATLDRAGQLAALGGFASKMGLASGPMAAALLLDDGNYGPLIDVAVVALLACTVACLLPATMLDRAQRRQATARSSVS